MRRDKEEGSGGRTKMGFLDWFAQPQWATRIEEQTRHAAEAADEIKAILERLEDDMATFAEAVQEWVDYSKDLKAQRDAALAALEDAKGQADAAAAALAQFQADDAATDASQLAAQAQDLADQLGAALTAVKSSDPTEPEVPADPTPEPETPVVPAPVEPAPDVPVEEPTDTPPSE